MSPIIPLSQSMTYREIFTMGHLLMSEKERLRKAMMEMVSQGRVTLKQASIQCQISYRHAKRLYREYRVKGDAGLVHQARGRKSNRKHPHREKIIARYQERYEGFGPTLASEKLAEDDSLIVDHNTLRNWLLEENLWRKVRKRSSHCQRRECKEQFGELVQMDGSIHDWFENGEYHCLLNMVDDATSKTLSHLESGETTRNVFLTMRNWIERYGIPLAVYVDFKNVYISPKNISHFQRACEKLGIRIIKAHSPQAKGRVERNHAIYQDRFVKELRLKNVKTIEGGNALLEGGFVDDLNQKFEKQARNPESAHRPLGEIDLNQIFCWEYERQVQNDWTFSFKNKIYQIKKPYGSTVRPKVKIQVRKHLDNSTSVWHKNENLPIKEILARPEVIKLKIIKENPMSYSERGKLSKLHSNWANSNSTLYEATSGSEEQYISKAYKVSRRLARS